jgi:hypothetical protein
MHNKNAIPNSGRERPFVKGMNTAILLPSLLPSSASTSM